MTKSLESGESPFPDPPPKNSLIDDSTMEMDLSSLRAFYTESSRLQRRVILDKLNIASTIQKYRKKFRKE